jgi:hypothetical protein
MADEPQSAEIQNGPVVGVNVAARAVRLSYVDGGAEAGAIVFPVHVAGEVAALALRGAQAIPPTAGKEPQQPSQLLAATDASIGLSSTPGVISLTFRFGDAAIGVALDVDSAQKLGQGLITASVKARRE